MSSQKDIFESSEELFSQEANSHASDTSWNPGWSQECMPPQTKTDKDRLYLVTFAALQSLFRSKKQINEKHFCCKMPFNQNDT
jgi:hypothetical protein